MLPGGASYNFWGTKLSINCHSIQAFETGHVRVDMMREVPSTKGAKKYDVFNKPFCIPVQVLKNNAQYTFSHEFNDETKITSKIFSHKLRFVLSVEEEYYANNGNSNNDGKLVANNVFDFSSKLWIDSISKYILLVYYVYILKFVTNIS